MRRAAAILAVFLALAGETANADPVPTAPAVQAVVDCRKVADDAARLACYDKAADALGAAQASGDIVSLDRAQRRQVRKEAFGLVLPSLAVLDAGREELNQVDDVVASANQDADSKWVLRLKSGAIWRQIDDEFLSRDPHPGSAVTIRKASLGSFMASVDGQPAIRVHREQ